MPSEQTTDGVRRAYDTVAATYASLLPDARAESALDLAMLEAFAATVGDGARVLDGGCGTGRISALLSGRGLAMEGVDLSPGMVAQARRAHPELAWTVGSLERLPHPDASYDGMVLWYSIIHTPPERQPALHREVARVLRPDGTLVVGFQHGEGSRDTGPAYAELGHDVTLVRHRYTCDEVSGWLADAGLCEVGRMVRPPVGRERDDQAVLLARR